MPLLWPGCCTLNIHKIVESASSSIEKIEYADHNLYRHVKNWSNQKGGGVNQGHSHLPFATFRVSSQFKEICASTMSGNRISGSSSKFCESDSLTSLTKGAEGPGGVHKMYNKNWTLILVLTKLLGLLSSTIQAVVPARLHIQNLQQLQIQSLKLKKSFQMNVKLTTLAKEELLWWISNLEHLNGKLCIQNHLDQMLIQTDASKKGWGAVCKGVRTGGLWSKEEQLLHVNVLELLAIKLALLTFTKSGSIKSIHFQIDNKTAISHLLKMGGTTNQTMIALSKEMWEVLLKKNITISAK